MAGKKLPLKVVQARGKKHLTNAEMCERERMEIKTPEVKQVRAPDFLPESMRKEFNDLSRQLVALGIFAKLDRDTLARYLLAHQLYLRAINHVQAAMDAEDADEAAKWSGVQDRYFKQCRNCANDMGLTITSRCRLVVPKAEEDEEDEFTKLLNRRREQANA